MNIGGIFNDNLTLLSSATPGDVRITPYRALHINLRTNAGVELGTISNPINVAGSFTATNPSVGVIGAPTPLSATLSGFKDQSGNLASVTLSAMGSVPVSIISGGGSGSNAAAGLTGIPVPTSADYLGINIG